MSTTLLTRPAQADVRARLLLTVLPVEAQGLVAAGQNLSYVEALFPFTEDTAVTVLLAQLQAATGFTDRGAVIRFMQHVNGVWMRYRLRESLLVYKFGLSSADPLEGVLLRRLAPSVGTYYAEHCHHLYRELGRGIEVLARWLAGGDEIFGDEQLGWVDLVADAWFNVLGFGERL